MLKVNNSYLKVSNIRTSTLLRATKFLFSFASTKVSNLLLETKQLKKMKKVEKVAAGVNFAAITVGKTDELNQHTHILGPGIEIPGKVFVGDSLDTTGAEISFQHFEPGAETGFLHTHKTHEELYIIVRGSGEFQVDGEVFPVAEGSVVRVSPAGSRSLRNTGNGPMAMICVQYKADSFDARDKSDGVLLEEKVKW